MHEKSSCCCAEHIDMAIDDFLVEYETFPTMEKCNVGKCDYCSGETAYILILTTETNQDNISE